MEETASFLCILGCSVYYTYPMSRRKAPEELNKVRQRMDSWLDGGKGLPPHRNSHPVALRPVVSKDPSAPQYEAS